MSRYKKNAALCLLFGCSLISLFWTLSVNNAFCYDDTTWMLNVSTWSYTDIFTFLPKSAYLDRPIGVIFLKMLYDLFGLDYTRHHAVLLGLHLVNVFFVFVCFKQICAELCGDEDRGFMAGIVTALFFGVWPKTHMAVWWDAAIFDLLGTTLALVSSWFFLRVRTDKRYRAQNFALCLLFYYLSARTKEMFLVLPLLFALLEIAHMLKNGKRSRLSGLTCGALCLFVVLLGAILVCKAQGSITNDPENPYYQSFHPVSIIKNLLRYCVMCFDVETGGWGFGITKSGVFGAVVVLCGLIFSLLLIWKKHRFEPFLCYIAIGISIVIVLPMVNQVHMLYLYFPSIFVGLLFAAFVDLFDIRKQYIISIALAVLFSSAIFSQGNRATIDYWMSVAQEENQTWREIREIQKPAPNSTIYVRNVSDAPYTPFFYANGGVCNLLYEDPTLNVVLLTSQERREYQKPYVVWEYLNGHITELQRESERELLIESVYFEMHEDGNAVIGIVPNLITDEMVIEIDGNELYTTVGSEFISANIPAEIIENKKTVELVITDYFGCSSEKYIQSIKK